MKRMATPCYMIAFLLLVQLAKAQTPKINLEIDNVDPKTALGLVTDQATWALTIDSGALAGAKKVSVHAKGKSIYIVLDEIAAGQPFYYYILGKMIVVVRRTSAESVASGKKLISTWGVFVNELGEGVEDVYVFNMQNVLLTTSYSNGKFDLKNVSPVGMYKYWSRQVGQGTFMLGEPGFKVPVINHTNIAYLDPVEVIHTGIQQLLKKRNIGASFLVPNEMIQQRSAPNFFDRLEGIVPGWQSSLNKVPNINQAKYGTLGGRTTIFSGTDPLLVLDNFPYYGRWEDLNWEDVESMTILRDASATALWGAMAANGVIVITTKSGKFNHPLRVSFHASVSVGSKPDAFDKDIMAPADRFFVDTFLTGKGYYNMLARSPGYPYVPEVALRMLNKSISDDELAALEKLDVRKDLNKYFYRNIFQQHFSLQMTGSKKQHAYLFSLGWDHSLPELRLSSTQRLNLMLNYNSRPVKGLEISINGASTYSRQHNIDNEPEIPVTYATLVDSSGNPSIQSFKRNKFFIDTAGLDATGRQKLKDWTYRPLKEFSIRNDNKIQIQQRVQIAMKFNKFPFLKDLEAGLYGQYQGITNEEKNLKDKDGFYVNDLVNSYSQVNGMDVYRPVPWGNILDYSAMHEKTWDIRAQLSYVKKLGNSNMISALLGNDRIFSRGDYKVKRIYDYTKERPEGANGLNYQTLFPQYYLPVSALYIPYMNNSKRTANNYVSHYMYTNFQLKGRYYASLVARVDRSNIYGSETNRRLTPLGSIAGAWDISNEDFYSKKSFVEFLKLRSSIGVSGNPPLGLSAIQTLTMTGINDNGDPVADINNPPLPNLRWETVMTCNMGLNFRMIRHIMEGSIDYYYKRSRDLVGLKWVDPTVGTASIKDNVASMAAHNIDVNLVSNNLNRILRWRTTFLFTYVKDFVTKTDTALQPAWMYCDQNRFSVVQNRPLYGIYSFPSAGLDETGDPIAPGKNKDYASMILRQGAGALNYRGRSTPAVFGSLTNEFNWKQFIFSFSFIYKLNYYYRKPGVNYTGIFDGSDPGSSDFSRRWQKPGDENRTDVPRMQYPADRFRDYFYIFSDGLVKRADFIRLQNIYFSYDLEGAALRKLHLRLANVYANCTNAGIVWRATKSKLDPDRLQGFPQPTIFTIGFKGTFK